MNYPKIIQNLINEFAKLPSVGPKTAERLVFHLLYQPQSELIRFGEAVEHLKENVRICSRCFNFSESDPCHICADSQRNAKIICVVAKPQDISAIEKTGSFKGVYHVLGGGINAFTNTKPEDIKIKQLVNRIRGDEPEEVILALNPDLEGESTTLYLTKLIRQYNENVKITRPARGLPMGANLEYADEVTLDNAFKTRQQL